MSTETTAKAYGATSARTPLEPLSISRRAVGVKDVRIEIHFCGVCHSDIHQVRSEWDGTIYPCVPGHEIIGRVTAVGKGVTRFAPGDTVGVGCMVNSCRACESCQAGEEQYCESGFVGTYNGPEKETGGITRGGYSESIVVDEDFVLRVPTTLDLAATAPLLCAGITTYSPLRHWGVGPGQKVGVVGLGGLGHMAVKFARAFGAHVVLFTTTPGKEADARRLGAHEVVVSKDKEAMKTHACSFDFILNTVSAPHDLNAYLVLLKRDATMTLVGVPEPTPVAAFHLILPRRHLAGSCIGSIRETQEMLDFCGQHNITSDIELIPIQKINEAFDRVVRSDVKFRFVIDMKSLK